VIDRVLPVFYYEIVRIIHVLEPFSSGVTTAVISIIKELGDFQHIVVHGSRMWVDTLDNVKGKFPPGVVFIPWKHAGREISLINDLKALFSLIAILKQEAGADTVIHLHSSKAGFLGRIAAFAIGKKQVIYTPHGASFIRTDVGPLRRSFFKFLEKAGGIFGGYIVGCGRSEAELYRGIGGGGKAVWVYNGVAPSGLKKAPGAAFVVFSGIASRQKDPAFFNAIAEAFPQVRFFWIGDGPLRGELKSANITCTGWVNRPVMEDYLSRTIIYLSSSAWEGLPFGVLEAMDASCALLLRDVPGNRDLVVSGENGYVYGSVDEGRKLLGAMLANREKTLSMGKKSRALSESEYSLETMGKNYRKLYTSLLETGTIDAPY
jgi:glycosyltransferase involved in cell wall biosynthesis